MPVSKKRKKEGKPVRRAGQAAPAAKDAEGVEVPESKPGHPQQRAGKPSNPFVAQQPKARSAQRGR